MQSIENIVKNNKQATNTAQETYTMKSDTYTDVDHNAISIDDVVKSTSSRSEAQYVVAALHTDNSGQQRVVCVHPEHGVQTFSPGSLVVVTTVRSRVAELTESISTTRGDIVVAAATLADEGQSEYWPFAAAIELTGRLQDLDALHKQLEAIDPDNDYLTQ